MPGFLLTMSAVVICSHGGKASATAPNPRVKVMGVPVPIPSPPWPIAGCMAAGMTTSVPPVPIPPGGSPCIMSTFLPPTFTMRVKSMGQGLLCFSSSTGPTVITPTQMTPMPKPLTITFAGQVRVKAM